MIQLNLELIAGDEIRVLIGHDRGVEARALLKVNELDQSAPPVLVVAPKHLRTLTPSFVQGLFSESVYRLGEADFYKHYKFDVPDTMLNDIKAGVDRILTSRHIAGA